MHFTKHWLAIFFITVGMTLAEPPAPNYVYSNYDNDEYGHEVAGSSSRGKGGHRQSDSYNNGGGQADDDTRGEYDGSGGSDSHSNNARPNGYGEDSYNNEVVPQKDDYGYNDLSPESNPYKGSPHPMTHSYSAPNNIEHGYNRGPRPYRPVSRFRLPSIMKMLRRRPVKVTMYTPTSSTYGSSVSSPPYGGSPSTTNYGSSYNRPSSSYSGGSGSNSYEGPSSSYVPSSSSYGGQSSSSYGGPSSSSSSYGGGSNSNSYNDRPSSSYEGHSGSGSRPRSPGKGYGSPPGNLYGGHSQHSHKSHRSPSKGYEVAKPSTNGYVPPPVASQYGMAMKGHSSPTIANSYGDISKGYASQSSAPHGHGRGRPPKGGHRNRYNQPPEYDPGYSGNRNSGHEYSQPDVYGGGYDMGTSHY